MLTENGLLKPVMMTNLTGLMKAKSLGRDWNRKTTRGKLGYKLTKDERPINKLSRSATCQL